MHLDAQLEGEYLLNFDLMVLSVSQSEAYLRRADERPVNKVC